MPPGMTNKMSYSINEFKGMFLCHVVGSMKYVNDHSPAKLREHHGNLEKKKEKTHMKVCEGHGFS